MASEHEANMLRATEMLASLGVQAIMVRPLTYGGLYDEWVQTTIAKSRRVSAALDTTTRGLQSLSDHAYDAAMHVKAVCDYLQTSFEATLDYRKPWSPQNRFGMNSTPELLKKISTDEEMLKELVTDTHINIAHRLWITHHFRNEFILLLLSHLNENDCEPHILSDDTYDNLDSIMKELRQFAELTTSHAITHNQESSIIVKILDAYTLPNTYEFLELLNKQCQQDLETQIEAEWHQYGFIPKWSTEDPRFIIQQHMEQAEVYTTNLISNKKQIKNQFTMTRTKKQIDIAPTYNVSIWRQKLKLNEHIKKLARTTYYQYSLMADLFNALGPLIMANIAYRLGTNSPQCIYLMTLGIVCRDYLLQSTDGPSDEGPPNSFLFKRQVTGHSAEYNNNSDLHKEYMRMKALTEPDASTTGITTQPAPQTTVNWMLEIGEDHPHILNAICHGTLDSTPKPTSNVPIIDGCKVNVMWQQELDLFSWSIKKQDMNDTHIHIIAQHRRNSLWLCHFSKAMEKVLCMFQHSVTRIAAELPRKSVYFGDYARSTHMFYIWEHWKDAIQGVTLGTTWDNADNITVPLQETKQVVKRINKLNTEFQREFPKRRAPFMPPHWWIQPDDTSLYNPPTWEKIEQANLTQGTITLTIPSTDDNEEKEEVADIYAHFKHTWPRPHQS